MKKELIIVLILLFFISCSKQTGIRISFKKMPVVNCFFTPDSIWNVKVSLSGSSDNAQGELVPNASVNIYSGGQLIETLIYSGDGNYVSPTFAKPVVNREYELRVDIPGYTEVKAISSIPEPVEISNISTDTVPVLYLYDPLSDPVQAFVANLNFTDNYYNNNRYYLLEPYYYNKDELNIYSVTPATIDSLKKYGYIQPQNNDSLILSSVYDSLFYGKTRFQARLNKLFGPQGYPFRIEDFSVAGKFDIHYPELYKKHLMYLKDVYFTQLNGYYSAVFCENNENIQFKNYPLRLYLNYYPDGVLTTVNGVLLRPEVEFFISASAISKEGYKYYSTYFQNIKNRTDPFSEPVNVYSNIENGTGIFAGKNSVLVQLW